LLFRELGQKGLVWHDRTVQAFFAAYWAMKFGAEQDRQLMKSWVVDAVGAPLGGFDDFWTFAVQMPDVHVEKSRWLTVFAPCYASPQWLQGAAEWVQWCRRMIYYSFASMQARSPETIAQWRASFEALANGTTKQKRIHREIEDGFRDIPAGICPFGGDSLEREQGEARRVSAFRMHQWPVTNEVYEEFDPAHWKQRWRNARNDAEHPLAKKRGRSGEDRCPVVNVSWYDAWCFAVWCGHRLPTELEWEHACRAGSESAWYFGNEEDELKNHAWCSEAWKGGSTHPVGGLLPNGNGLYDMHGNVWEWCVDPREPWASHRVLRGGSWFLRGEYCRCAYRLTYNPDFRSQYYGFRLAAIPDGAKLVQQRHA
jgi:formylglycine-generating enzyme required for sulfatase activity